MTRYLSGLVVVAAALTQTAFGGEYLFTVVAQTWGHVDGFSYTVGPPVMGEDGLIYFPGRKTQGSEETWALFSADESSIKTVYDAGDQYQDILTIAVNENREIAFSAIASSGFRGVYNTDGNSLITLAETNEPAWEFMMPDINAAGQVAFIKSHRHWPGPEPVTVYRGDGVGPLTTISDGVGRPLFGVPSINDAGSVAYAAVTPAGKFGEYVGDGGRAELVFESSERLSSPTLLNDGTIVFRTPDKVLLSQNSETRVLADNSQGLRDLLQVNMPPAYTESGNLAFLGSLSWPRGGEAFLTGPNALTDSIVARGDVLLGEIVDGVTSWSPINEKGQVALLTSFRTAGGGTQTMLIRADPIPEPSTIVLAILAVGLLTIDRGRRCLLARAS